MELLPQKGNGRLMAVALVIVAGLLIYGVFFHWFVVRHMALSEEVDLLSKNLAGFRAQAAQRPQLEEAVEQVRRASTANNLFLKEDSFNLAAAEMIRRLKELVNNRNSEMGDQGCQVISTQNVRSREVERFERVTVKVRMRCELEDLAPVLYELENGTPLMFVDAVNIYQQRSRSRSGGLTQTLDVRFDYHGYLRHPDTDLEAGA